MMILLWWSRCVDRAFAGKSAKIHSPLTGSRDRTKGFQDKLANIKPKVVYQRIQQAILKE
ncbi:MULTISPECIES: hypothetical protein [unclassified Microcoleus]|uniref:hypothetical protein n=1 Tax=unclassified Microcoleus TaxID=2642155 RepID=UPI002FD37E3C